jgi:glycosyltransferase involved in cell wall biosynthesis
MKSNLKSSLAIIGTVGVPARYGGFETLAHQLVENLNEEYDITVYNSTKHYSAKERVKKWNGAKIKYIPLAANGVQSIFYNILSIIHAVFYSEVLLILGVSGCLFLPVVKLFSPNKKIIVNIDGLEWRRAKWNKYAKTFLSWSERAAVWCASEIIADNAAIQKYILDRYGKKSNLIEYGADHNQVEFITPSTFRKYPFLEKEYAFKVARIEPENNIHIILEAFERQTDLPLVLVGNWKNNDYGKNLQDKYADTEHLHLLDPIYESSLLNQMRSNAKVYIHGHSEGGTNPSLVEAMYLGLPILSFDIIYNKVTTENQALYFENADELFQLIQNISALDLNKISSQLLEVANRRYLWSAIADRYSNLVVRRPGLAAPIFNFELSRKLREAVA